MNYQRILVALELNPDSDLLLIKKAQEMTQQVKDVYLFHAVESYSSYGAAYGISAGVDVEEVLREESTKQLATIAESLGVATDHQIIKFGPAKFMIVEAAKELEVDLIVVGSHGRHGVRLLLGSTANAVLHEAQCDVLAIRIDK